MPPVEPRVVEIFIGGDGRGVECTMMRMTKLDLLQTLVLLHEAVANDLDLRLVRDGFEIRVKNGAFGVYGFAVAVGACCFGIEALGEFILSLGRYMALVFEYKDLMGEECGADSVEFSV